MQGSMSVLMRWRASIGVKLPQDNVGRYLAAAAKKKDSEAFAAKSLISFLNFGGP